MAGAVLPAKASTPKVNAYDVAAELIAHVPMKIVNGALYVYNGLVYHFMTTEVMNRLIMQTCRQYVRAVGNAAIIRQIYKLIQAEPNIAFDGTRPDDHLVAFENGLLNLNDGKLYPHSPVAFVTTLVHGKFFLDQAGHCPVFNAYLNTVTDGNALLEQRIWEVLGYCLTPDVGEKCFSSYRKYLIAARAYLLTS